MVHEHLDLYHTQEELYNVWKNSFFYILILKTLSMFVSAWKILRWKTVFSDITRVFEKFSFHFKVDWTLKINFEQKYCSKFHIVIEKKWMHYYLICEKVNFSRHLAQHLMRDRLLEQLVWVRWSLFWKSNCSYQFVIEVHHLDSKTDPSSEN